MNSQTTKAEISITTEKAITQYLRKHPDFFTRHLNLLADMYLPHESGEAISLVERQIGLLREQKQITNKKLRELIETAKENERLSYTMQTLCMRLLETDSWQEVLVKVTQTLKEDLQVEEVLLKFMPYFDNAALRTTHMDYFLAQDSIHNRLMQLITEKPFCGQLPPEQRKNLFAETADTIASLALIPLRYQEKTLALIILGSQDYRRFTPAHDTLFLSHFGAMIGHAIFLHIYQNQS